MGDKLNPEGDSRWPRVRLTRPEEPIVIHPKAVAIKIKRHQLRGHETVECGHVEESAQR